MRGLEQIESDNAAKAHEALAPHLARWLYVLGWTYLASERAPTVPWDQLPAGDRAAMVESVERSLGLAELDMRRTRRHG